MFNKAKRFQNLPSEIGRKKSPKTSSVVVRKCETPKETLRREGTFVITQGNSISQKSSPAQSSQKGETGIVSRTERWITRRKSQNPNTVATNSSATTNSTPLHSPYQEGSSLDYSSNRSTIRRNTPKVDVEGTSKGSIVDRKGPNESSQHLLCKTFETESSPIIHSSANRDGGKNSSRESVSITKSKLSTGIQDRASNKSLQAIQCVTCFGIRTPSPNILDETLPLKGIDMKKPSSPKSNVSNALQSSLSDAIQDLRLLSSQFAAKIDMNIETRVGNLESELKQDSLNLAKKLEFDSDKVLQGFTSKVSDVLGSQNNEKLWNIITRLSRQLKDAISKNTRLENMYNKICEDNARKEMQHVELIEELRAEVEAMEIAFRMNKILKYFPDTAPAVP